MIYDVIYLCYAILCLPKLAYERLFLKKSHALLKRIFPKAISTTRETIWVHAVSLGETKAASSLVKKLKENYFVILSSTTYTGFEEAKKIPADEHLYLPLDLSFIVKRVLSKINLKALIFVETDFWWNFIRFAKKRGAKVFLVSAKVSNRSFKRYQTIPFIKKIFSRFDFVGAQNEEYKSLFEKLNCSKVGVTGNLKINYEPQFLTPSALSEWKERFRGEFITVASTHFPEEEELLALLAKRSDFRIFLAPRHPERFGEVESLLKAKSIPYDTWDKRGEGRVVLVNKMGLLPICYQLSRAAVVGGSFSSHIGGHNILEPIFYHIPVLFGPNMFAQKELKKMVLDFNCGISTSIENLEKDLDLALKRSQNYNLLINSLSNPLNKILKEIIPK